MESLYYDILIHPGTVERWGQAQLDDFTLNVLCNPEVIEIDQDPLGQCARVVPLGEETFAMVKFLEDGSKAIGLFNRGEYAVSVAISWTDARLTGKQTVRDLWRQKDLGEFADRFEANVGRHGVVMVRVSPGGSGDR